MRATIPALTIWQPWASLIVAGAKPYEFRRYAAPKSLRGRIIAIHAGARPLRIREVEDLLRRMELGNDGPCLDAAALHTLRFCACGGTLPLGSVIGLARLGEPVRCIEHPERFGGDSDRIDEHVWAWPLTEARPISPMVPFRGAQGFWRFPRPCMAEAAA